MIPVPISLQGPDEDTPEGRRDGRGGFRKGPPHMGRREGSKKKESWDTGEARCKWRRRTREAIAEGVGEGGGEGGGGR